ncbi:hypothetical protein QYF36_012725 [Acer negundo]|nr:hypothetical protein QYF36_012725 [Acer negundo]
MASTSRQDADLSANSASSDPNDGRQRFLLELEFVQCLANPNYIHYLAQNHYFEDEAFIGYLKYLKYWKRPEYVKFIITNGYSHCLYFLNLLQRFRSAMAHPATKELAHRQQFYFWKNYKNNRLKHVISRHVAEPVASASASASSPPPLLLTADAITASASVPASSHM